MDVEALFLKHLELIERIAAAMCRRHLHDDPDDFVSWVRLRLLEDDYAILRKHRGDSSLPTYLTTVITNLSRDYRHQKWGKWRPSAAARKRGTAAILLETRISRDGHTVEEAVEILKRNENVRESREELYRLAEELPHHPPRRFAGEEGLARMGVEGDVDGRVVDEELRRAEERTEAALRAALADLTPRERTLLQLRFEQEVPVSHLARNLGTKQRRLYTEIETALRRLHRAMERAGVDAEEAMKIVGWEGFSLQVHYDGWDEHDAKDPGNLDSPSVSSEEGDEGAHENDHEETKTDEDTEIEDEDER